jgi:tetratricopeptide (TPR) repeat protein
MLGKVDRLEVIGQGGAKRGLSSLSLATAAIEVLQALLSVDPAHRQALAEISELCSVQNRWREAEGYLEQLSDVARDDPETVRDALLQRCHILEDQLGEEDRALEVLERILGQFPRDREALEHCLAIYKRRGNWEKTVEVLEEMVHGGSISERVDGTTPSLAGAASWPR